MISIYTVDSDGYQFNVAGIKEPLDLINRTIELCTVARETENAIFLSIQLHNLLTAVVTLAQDVAYVRVGVNDYKMEMCAGNGGIYYNNSTIDTVPSSITNPDDRARIFKQSRNLLIKKMMYLILRDAGYVLMADKALSEYRRDRAVYEVIWVGNENESLDMLSFELIDNK